MRSDVEESGLISSTAIAKILLLPSLGRWDSPAIRKWREEKEIINYDSTFVSGSSSIAKHLQKKVYRPRPEKQTREARLTLTYTSASRSAFP